MSSSGKPDPAREAKMLARLFTEKPEALDVASDEEVERQMNAAGIATDGVPTVEEMMARAEKRATVPPAMREPVLPVAKRGPASLWAVAAALVVFLVVAWWKGAAIVAYFRQEPIGPDNEHMLPSTPAERAAKLRQEALALCGVGNFAGCETKLDAARELEPAGESAPSVVAARKQIDDAVAKMDGGKLKLPVPP